MTNTIFGVRQRYNPTLELAGIILNRFNAHSVRQKAAIQQLAFLAGRNRFHNHIATVGTFHNRQQGIFARFAVEVLRQVA